MAKPNYQFEKRQKDLAKKNKQEEKRRQKLANKVLGKPVDSDEFSEATDSSSLCTENAPA